MDRAVKPTQAASILQRAVAAKMWWTSPARVSGNDLCERLLHPTGPPPDDHDPAMAAQYRVHGSTLIPFRKRALTCPTMSFATHDGALAVFVEVFYGDLDRCWLGGPVNSCKPANTLGGAGINAIIELDRADCGGRQILERAG